MAQRLYLSGTAAAINIGAAVTGGGIWESAIGTITTRKLVTTANSTLAMASNVTVVGTGVNPNDILYGQWMTDPLPNGKLINGTVSAVCACRESSTNTNAFTQLGVFVVDNTGALIHTLIGQQTTGGTEFNNPSANNRMYPRGNAGSGVAVSSYTTVNGTSRIVVEWGVRIETTRVADSVYQYLGNDGLSDLPLSDGADNSLVKNPWVEFSADIYTPPAGAGARSMAAVSMSGYYERSDAGLFVPAGRAASGLYLPAGRV